MVQGKNKGENSFIKISRVVWVGFWNGIGNLELGFVEEMRGVRVVEIVQFLEVIQISREDYGIDVDQCLFGFFLYILFMYGDLEFFRCYG